MMFLGTIKMFRAFLREQRLADVPAWQKDILYRVRPFTMAGVARTLATISAVEYLEKNKITGCIVECGVWRGGQMMAAALALQHMGAKRELYLFDTFSGMTPPEARDVDHEKISAKGTYQSSLARPEGQRWCEAGIEEVRKNLRTTGYPESCMHLIPGDVEKSIPAQAPEQIAYLRLDTDWYASTKHELDHLFPRVVSRGVVAVDDYGHWQGAREATDEYLAEHGICALLHRIDYSGRQFVKL